jgi:hypothetical protein
MRIIFCATLLAACSLTMAVRAETRSVGPGKTYAKPCAAFAAAQDGDLIEIDAQGSYDGDVCAIARSRLTIRGVNGRAHIDAAGASAGGKAIWVIQGSDTVVEDIELSGCQVKDKNGAGIRQEGRNLTVRRCFFHDNENGILGGADAMSTYLIEDSEFARNGAGDGQSHNMYIGEIGRFTLRGSYSHHSKDGHLVKSRALRNDIRYNRLTEEAGDASYELDLPQGGASYVIGNLFQKSATAPNGSFISYARETKRNAGSALWVVNNTFVNARSAGTFVAVAKDVQSVLLRNNVFVGTGTPCDLTSATSDGNFAGDAKLVNASSYDFALAAGSPAIDHGVEPGTGAGASLAPLCQYAHPAHAVNRERVAALDQGALEYASSSSVRCGEVVPTPTDAGVSEPDARVLDASAAEAGAADARAESSGDASATGDAGAAPKEDGGCQGAGVGAQLWSVACALLLALRARRRGDTVR